MLGFEELRPRAYHEERTALSLDVLNPHILIVLRCVRAHLEPKHAGGSLHVNSTENNIMVIQTLRTECQTAVYLAIRTIFYNNISARAIVGILICPSSFTALQHNGIVVHMHITAVNQHVLTHIQINGIRTRATALRINRCHVLRRSKNETA